MPEKEKLSKEIRAALEHEPRINLHRFAIQLSFADGDLIVEGEAEHIVAKKLALELAGAVSGLDRVVDRLRVVPAESMSDAQIRDHVRDALLQESALENCSIRARVKEHIETSRESTLEPAREIIIEVQEGVVLLNGQVPSLSHKRPAGVLAWRVPGSRDVINGLEESPVEEDNDDEVTDAVRLVLEKNPFVNADGIRVGTRNYVVTLEGLVRSKEAREMGEFDAWYVFGVDKVVNKIDVEQ